MVAAVRMQWRELRERRRKPLTELRNQSLDREAVSAPNFIIAIYIQGFHSLMLPDPCIYLREGGDQTRSGRMYVIHLHQVKKLNGESVQAEASATLAPAPHLPSHPGFPHWTQFTCTLNPILESDRNTTASFHLTLHQEVWRQTQKAQLLQSNPSSFVPPLILILTEPGLENEAKPQKVHQHYHFLQIKRGTKRLPNSHHNLKPHSLGKCGSCYPRKGQV